MSSSANIKLSSRGRLETPVPQSTAGKFSPTSQPYALIQLDTARVIPHSPPDICCCDLRNSAPNCRPRGRLRSGHSSCHTQESPDHSNIMTLLHSCDLLCIRVYTGNSKHSLGWIVRISRDKVNKVAHVVSDALAEMNEVDFVEDRNTIRLEVRKVLEELLNQEERIDQAARQKIENQKRTILEGSQEWDILYRKYYNEEVKKLGF